MIAAPSLLCIGNVTIDDAHLPDGTVEPDCLGGDAVYATLAARLFDPSAEMLAPIGSELPEDALAALQAAGLDPDAQPRRETPTIRNVVTYRADGGRTWDLVGGEEAFDVLSVDERDLTDRHRASRGALVAAMSLRAQSSTVSALADSGVSVYLDLQEDYIRGNEDVVAAMISRSAVFLPSADEARQLAGEGDWVEACRRFAELGPATVVVKIADRGSLVYERGEAVHVGVHRVDPVDSTGAGDAFCGAFAAVHLQTGDAVRAARAGSAAASFAVEGFGTSALLRATPAAALQRMERLGG